MQKEIPTDRQTETFYCDLYTYIPYQMQCINIDIKTREAHIADCKECHFFSGRYKLNELQTMLKIKVRDFMLNCAKRLSRRIKNWRKIRNLHCSIHVYKFSRRTFTLMNSSIDDPPLHSSTDCLKTCTRNSFYTVWCRSHLYCS